MSAIVVYKSIHSRLLLFPLHCPFYFTLLSCTFRRLLIFKTTPLALTSAIAGRSLKQRSFPKSTYIVQDKLFSGSLFMLISVALNDPAFVTSALSFLFEDLLVCSATSEAFYLFLTALARSYLLGEFNLLALYF